MQAFDSLTDTKMTNLTDTTMTITERFLNYTKFDTQSAEESQTVPSTSKQLIFARYLKEEMEREGLQEVEMDEKGYLYATLPANLADSDEPVPTIGFISHYDTSPDCEGIVLSPKKFPELLGHVGEDLIVTDGHTLLGADDKAGIAEIMQAMCYLRDHPDIRHGKIRVAFNPDEEIGMGAHHFDVAKFGCDWAYTMDGGEVGELELSVHPGYAKGKMVNANRLAVEFAAMLPADETPETTEGYEGFYHLIGMQTNTELGKLSYIIRDHDREKFEARKQFVLACAERMNERYGEGTVVAEVKDQYYNMKEMVAPQMHIIDKVLVAMQQVGVKPQVKQVKPIRGGTDGAQLSFKGLPCPNIFAGGINFHGPYEFVPIQSMEKAMQVVVKICQR